MAINFQNDDDINTLKKFNIYDTSVLETLQIENLKDELKPVSILSSCKNTDRGTLNNNKDINFDEDRTNVDEDRTNINEDIFGDADEYIPSYLRQNTEINSTIDTNNNKTIQPISIADKKQDDPRGIRFGVLSSEDDSFSEYFPISQGTLDIDELHKETKELLLQASSTRTINNRSRSGIPQRTKQSLAEERIRRDVAEVLKRRSVTSGTSTKQIDEISSKRARILGLGRR